VTSLRPTDEGGKWGPAELADVAQAPNDVVAGLGVRYPWVDSYVAGDQIYRTARRRPGLSKYPLPRDDAPL
jgi:hypothetical protein